MPEDEDVRDIILSTVEESLDAQLRAIHRLRKEQPPNTEKDRPPRLSQVDMAYDILKKTRKPLHIAELLHRIHAAFGVRVDRESLVSSLTKKVARGDRFVRTHPNTFGLRAEVR